MSQSLRRRYELFCSPAGMHALEPTLPRWWSMLVTGTPMVTAAVTTRCAGCWSPLPSGLFGVAHADRGPATVPWVRPRLAGGASVYTAAVVVGCSRRPHFKISYSAPRLGALPLRGALYMGFSV